MPDPKLIPKKYIKESSTVYKNTKDIKAALERAKRTAASGNYVTPVTNGTTDTEKNIKNKIQSIKVYDKNHSEISYSATYKEANAVKSQEEVTYIVKLDEKNKDTLINDLKKIKFYFWVQDEDKKRFEIITPTKTLSISRKRISTESSTDIFELRNIETLTTNLDKAYYYAKVQYDLEKKEARLTIKWSKWLDKYMVRVEATQHIAKGDGGSTTCSRYVQAQPEIIKGFWTNDKREDITKKTVGYKDTVYMCLKTLGMTNREITTELWEEGVTYMGSTDGNDETICMNENIAWKITERYSYKKLELPDQDTEEYKKQREGIWEADPLELYFKIPSEKETTGYEVKYGSLLYLTTKERISDAYFAKEIKQEAIQDGTVKDEEPLPRTHTVQRNESLSLIAKKYGIPKEWEKLGKDNDMKAPWYVTIGKVLQLPDNAVIPEDTTKPKEESKPQAQQETVYERIDSTGIGSEVWLVVETANLHGKKVSIEVFDNEELLADDDGTPITLLKDDVEVTKLENITIDDTGKAKVKVKLRKKSDDDYKKQKEKFKDDKVAKLFLKVKCEGEKTHKKEFLDGEEFEVKNNNAIHIYFDGTIDKLDLKGLDKVSYIYHDKNDKLHDLGSFDIIEVDKLKKGKTTTGFRSDTASETITYNQTGVDAKETRIYSDGDLITKGDFRVKYREYKKSTGKAFLVKMKALNYSKDSLLIKFVWHQTLRHYSNPELFAGFVGALAENNFSSIECTGSSYKDSSCYPSTSHVNGESIDTAYLDKKTDEQKFINALWKFGFKLHYVGTSMSYTHGTKDKYHNDHLHSGSFTPNYKK